MSPHSPPFFSLDKGSDSIFLYHPKRQRRHYLGGQYEPERAVITFIKLSGPLLNLAYSCLSCTISPSHYPTSLHTGFSGPVFCIICCTWNEEAADCKDVSLQSLPHPQPGATGCDNFSRNLGEHLLHVGDVAL
ncbi:hypothetical protein KIL84_015084 [Mauremys mutica]|uniref:Uncharacterized protein n=1 Tax=Mauremys mutica TaxID=74926 RepID=A0A9D4B7T9_9SAUR|nr:hypothetical protein KIL84_015084 [Mauremys mutica]